MPSWCEGVMKIRGKYDDVERFILNQIVKVKKMDSIGWYDIVGVGYVKGTYKGHVTQDYIQIKDRPGGRAITVFNYSEAFRIHANDWLKIAKEYNVDVKGVFAEGGSEFAQQLLIENGSIVMNEELYYEDWDWDFPFPNLGG